MKQLLIQLRHLLRLEFRDWPQTFALMLFMWAIAYVMYRVRGDLSRPEFNLVFWVFLLLVSINVATKSTNQRSSAEQLLSYTLISPVTALMSKVLFNILFLTLAAFVFYGSLLLLYAEQINWSANYGVLVLMGSVAIGTVTAFISALSQQLSNQSTLLSILAIPVLIPVTILLHSIGSHVVMGNELQGSKYLAISGITLLSLALSAILFPYIWKK